MWSIINLLLHSLLIWQLHADPLQSPERIETGLQTLRGTRALGGRSWSVVGRQEQIITGGDSKASDGFGTSVASNGQVVVVGAPNARVDGTSVPSGAVYVFRKNSGKWSRDGKLYLASSVNKDFFGWTVAIDQNVLAVGAYLAFGDVKSVGLVYIYGYDASKQMWKEEKVLGMNGVFDPGGEQKPGWGNSVMPGFYYFGQSVALENQTVLAGAYGYDEKGSFAGAVFVYEYGFRSVANQTSLDPTSWRQIQRLIPEDLQSFSLFGWSVALSGDVAVVGAYGDTINARPYAGSAFVFERSGSEEAPWLQVARLTAKDAMAHDHFGCAVAVRGDVIAVSSQRPSADKTVADGIVYLYASVAERSRINRNNPNARRWVYFKQLQVYAEDSNHIFGFSLSMYDDLLLVGFSGDDSFGTSAKMASAYLYSIISSADGSIDAVRDVSLFPFNSDELPVGSQVRHFGCSVAVHDKIIVVGASQADGQAAETGTVFSFTAGIDYFPVGDSTYDFLVYFLPGAFIAITMGSFAFVIIGTVMNNRERRYIAQHLPSSDDGDMDTSSVMSDSVSMASSSRGLIP